MSVRTRTTGFYQDDAARIAAEAARVAPPTEPVMRSKPERAPIELELTARQVPRTPPQRTPPQHTPPEVLIDEPQRPPLAPAPAINENYPVPTRPYVERPTRIRMRRIIAWIVVAPFYAACVAGCIVVLVIATKFFLKL